MTYRPARMSDGADVLGIGSGGATARVGGLLHSDVVQKTTAGTTEEVLSAYTLKGKTLLENGRGIRITAGLLHAANTNNTLSYLKFGGVQLCVRATAVSGAGVRLTAEVFRRGDTSQVFSAFVTGSTSPQAFTGTLSANLLADVLVEVTATTSVAAGDLSFELLSVEAL